MQVAPLRNVEVAILHDRFNPIDRPRLSAAVQALAAQSGLQTPMEPLGGDGATNIYVGNGAWYLLLSQSNQPLGPQGFTNALNQPATHLADQDMTAAVREHRANSFVTLGKGVPVTRELESQLTDERLLPALMSAPPELLRPMNIFDGRVPQPLITHMTDLADVKMAMELAAALTGLLVGNNPARAIHWCMSDNLMPQSHFEAITNSGVGLTPLALRPNLFSSHNRLEPGKPLGMVLQGSQFLLGRPLRFEEAPIDMSWIMSMCAGFITYSHMRGAVIGDGETFGSSADEKIRFRHVAPSENLPLGEYVLTAEEVPQFGYSSAKAQGAERKGLLARLFGR